jgi:hypothetical protein
MSEISLHELETQYGELLPVRETLGFVNFGSFNTALTAVHQSATAVQALTIDSSNTAANIADVSTGAGIIG